MREVVGDLWEVEADARVITTNGTIKKNGAAVMGRGVAKQASVKYPILPYALGDMLKSVGNVPTVFRHLDNTIPIITLPVKHEWYQKADLALIEKSLQLLVDVVDKEGFEVVVLPRPGCGNGGLAWADVRHILAWYLDDRFLVLNYNGEPLPISKTPRLP